MTSTSEEVKKEEAAPVVEGSPETIDAAESLDDSAQRPKASEVYNINDMKSFADDIINVSGEKINNCYQCKKCSNGCPITFAMDIQPHLVIKMIQLGMENEVLKSKTIWLCAACETCGTRCPNEIKLADMMDALRQRALKKGVTPGVKNAPIFHKAFNESVGKYGRVYEIGMVRQFTMKAGGIIGKLLSGALMNDAKLGLKLYRRGKLGLTPHKIKGMSDIKKIFNKEQKG